MSSKSTDANEANGRAKTTEFHGSGIYLSIEETADKALMQAIEQLAYKHDLDMEIDRI